MKTFKQTIKTYQTTLYISAVGFIFANSEAMASLVKLAEHSNTVNDMVKGPVGTAALLIGTIGGSVGSLMKGNIWLAVAILIIGVLLGFHIDNISTIFNPQH